MILLLKGQVNAYTRKDGTFVGPHFRSAVKFATEKHRGQKRGDGKTPYISHPLKVAKILRNSKVNDPCTLAAAVLHDTIEDTGVSHQDLVSMFGKDVADTVLEVTNDESLPRRQKKQAQIDKAPKLSQRAAQVKLADKIANLTDIVMAPPPWDAARKLEYINHARQVVGGMTQPHPVLLDMFRQAYDLCLSAVTGEAERHT